MTAGQRPVAPVSDSPAPSDDQAGAAQETQGPRLADLSRLGRLFGKVIAPATLVTGLLFYFGWSFTYWYFRYFGVNSTLLGSTTQDYLMRSVDPLFVPVTAVAAAVLVVLWARALIPDRLTTAVGVRWARRRVLVTGVAGFLLVALAGGAIVNATVQENTFLVAPLGLAFGVPLIAYAVHHAQHRRGRAVRSGPETLDWKGLTEWAAVFLLVATGLFWAVSEYASAVGHLRATEFAGRLHDEPFAVLYSQHDLSLSGPGVTEVRCAGVDPAYRFRYDGLALVLEAGGQYVLLPREWTRGEPALIVAKNDSLRLEFSWAPNDAEGPRC